MADIIQLLPDSVANQIAAGEVIQRPASVIKELMENGLDAGATSITVIVKDAGKALIQVIDNGQGMSETDARMAFERHATSKISCADDLFALSSMGFRGEALASIAAIAFVELKTCKEGSELGTRLIVQGSEVKTQETISCPVGSNFLIKNLFFNVPARRKFLKSNTTELKHIITEFQRVVLTRPDVAFQFVTDGNTLYKLTIGSLRHRVTQMMGDKFNKSLVSVEAETGIVKITGFVGRPEYAKKTGGDQYFFVNNRFMKHAYFHKAVSLAFQDLLSSDSYPAYFIYFDIDPREIDINIHPTKTEIKFSDAPSVFTILRVTVKEALGKFNITPSLNFDAENVTEIPYLDKSKPVIHPSIDFDPSYNPFASENKPKNAGGTGKLSANTDFLSSSKKPIDNWEMLYAGIDKEADNIAATYATEQALFTENSTEKELPTEGANVLVHRKKYLVTSVTSGLMLVHIRRAHERILYEHFEGLEGQSGTTQQTLFPATLELSATDMVMFKELDSDLIKLGFDIREFGKTTVIINGYPPEFTDSEPSVLFLEILENYKTTRGDVASDYHEKLIRTMVKAASVNSRTNLQPEEVQDLLAKLFACKSPNFAPDGSKIIHILENNETDKLFAR